jgi:hypothetical protein
MADITDDQREIVIALEGAGDTPASHIRVRDDELIAEIRNLSSAVKAILERLHTVEGI